MPTQKPSKQKSQKGEKIVKKAFGIPEFPKPDRDLTKEEVLALKADVISSKNLLSWKAYSRVYKKRTKMYYINVGIIVFLLGLISLTINEPVVALVVLSLGFVAYVLAYIEPDIIENKINQLGLVTNGNAFLWAELSSFWYSQRNSQTILNIAQNRLRPPLVLIIDPKDIDKITKILSEPLEYRRNYKGFIVDKMADRLVEKIPLE